MLEGAAIEQRDSVQHVVNAVIDYHFVNEVGFQGLEPNDTCRINYNYKENGWDLEEQQCF